MKNFSFYKKTIKKTIKDNQKKLKQTSLLDLKRKFYDEFRTMTDEQLAIQKNTCKTILTTLTKADSLNLMVAFFSVIPLLITIVGIIVDEVFSITSPTENDIWILFRLFVVLVLFSAIVIIVSNFKEKKTKDLFAYYTFYYECLKDYTKGTNKVVKAKQRKVCKKAIKVSIRKSL